MPPGAGVRTERRDVEPAFARLQARLRPVESVDHPAHATECTVLAIPSYNFDQEVLDLHAEELPALEERCLYWVLALRRPKVRVVVVTSLPIPPEVVDYYLRLIPEVEDAHSRIRLLTVDDASPRPLAEKIRERPKLVARLRKTIHERDRAFIMSFNVKGAERDLALELDVPIYGVDHRFAHYGTKTGARRLFQRVGVSHPLGESGLRGTAELGDALLALRDARPGLEAAVVKHDDAVYGEGNRVIVLRDLPPPGTPEEEAALDVRLRSLSDSYLEKLVDGGIVEEMIAGEIRSPSVQMRILPGGEPLVLSTHDQVLGGELGQTFVACRFPAERDYAPAIVAEAVKVGRQLAAEGVIGRFGIDFVVARRGEDWTPYALEINLREGGTSHPYGTLWLLTDGSLDEKRTAFRTPAGRPKHYFATDRLGNPDYQGIPVGDFLAASTAAGLDWDPEAQTGAVYYLARSLERKGEIGVTAIGDTPGQANEIYLAVTKVLDQLAENKANDHPA